MKLGRGRSADMVMETEKVFFFSVKPKDLSSLLTNDTPEGKGKYFHADLRLTFLLLFFTAKVIFKRRLDRWPGG